MEAYSLTTLTANCFCPFNLNAWFLALYSHTQIIGSLSKTSKPTYDLPCNDFCLTSNFNNLSKLLFLVISSIASFHSQGISCFLGWKITLEIVVSITLLTNCSLKSIWICSISLPLEKFFIISLFYHF